MGIEESYVNDLYIDKSDYSSTFLYMDMEQPYGNRAYKERMLWSLSETPDFVDEDYFDGDNFMSSFISIPLYSRLGNQTV